MISSCPVRQTVISGRSETASHSALYNLRRRIVAAHGVYCNLYHSIGSLSKSTNNILDSLYKINRFFCTKAPRSIFVNIFPACTGPGSHNILDTSRKTPYNRKKIESHV